MPYKMTCKLFISKEIIVDTHLRDLSDCLYMFCSEIIHNLSKYQQKKCDPYRLCKKKRIFYWQQLLVVRAIKFQELGLEQFDWKVI